MKKVYLAAIAGNIGMLSVGQFFGWASPTLPKLKEDKDPDYPVHLTVDEASWIVALLTFGTTFGSVICAFVVNTLGRKNTMLFAAVPSIIGWLMIVFATSPWMLFLSRIISGLALGIAYTVTPMYLGEISPPKVRGNLISMLTVAVQTGIAIEYAIGPFLSVKNLALVSLVSPCLFIVVFLWVPESPYYLMLRNNKTKAIKSLVQLRGKEDVYKEADRIEGSIKANFAKTSGFRELLFVPSNRRALKIKICLSIFQQMSGIHAILQYAETIFNEANTNLEGKYLTMMLGVAQLICAIVCMFITDRYGRKLLLIISSIGSACSTTMVATYFTLQYYDMDTSALEWLPASGIFMYIITYGVGLAPLPSTISGEIYPMNVKALGIMLSLAAANITAFLVAKLYGVFAYNIGTYVSFWIFSASNCLASLYIFFCVPETKGKTLEQIQEKLNKLQKKRENR